MEKNEAFAVHPWGSGWAVGDGRFWLTVGVRSKEEAEEISAAAIADDFSLETALRIADKYAKIH